VLKYNIILRPELEGGFTVVVPALLGCITYGKNLKEAKEMVCDAINAYLVSVKKHGGSVISDKDNLFTMLEITHA
ncbi:MAG: type II toxin-antitoxin system HicB family antitoxin, partial [Candidatus Paceibacterota bacterium]